MKLSLGYMKLTAAEAKDGPAHTGKATHCRLLGLANSLVRFQGWPLPT
jgi:cytidylate kinase